jgi:RNA polymerase subunit RPABC4/transcription elongation factor Spt4
MVIQIKEILDKLIDGNPGIPRVLWEFKIASAWAKINPPNVAQNSSPDKLVGGVLYINARNSAWAQQINLMKPEIILKLNAFIGERAVGDIRLKTGFAPEAARGAAERPKKSCRECGVEFAGGEELCPSCLRRAKKEKEIKLIKLVERDPKIGVREAGKLVPNVSEIELHRVKRDVMARKADRDYRARRRRG